MFAASLVLFATLQGVSPDKLPANDGLILLAEAGPASDAAFDAGQAPLTSPSMGLGLNGVADWTTEYPFIDVFKTSRDWTGHLPNQWGGVSLQAIDAVRDKEGWLVRLPDGASSVSALLLTELPAGMVSAAGTYRLTYEGDGRIEIDGATVLQRRPGVIMFDYTPTGQQMVRLDIQSINARNPLRNIRVVHERDIWRLEAGEIFNPAWLALVGDMRLLRFMDWMHTNDSTQGEWSQRSRPEDPSWATAKGVPLEVMVELANQTGTDPWFTIPHLANEDYITNFVTYVRHHLDPKLKAHFEYSNEVWNWGFQQAQWADQNGKKLWPDEGSAWVQFYAGKAVEMAKVIDNVYGDAADDRVVKVIATQTGWLGLEEPILTAPRWRADHPQEDIPARYFDAYAITGYFDGALGRDEKAATVKQWLAASRADAEAAGRAAGKTGDDLQAFVDEHKFDSAGQLAIRELRDGSVTGNHEGSLKQLFDAFAYHKKIADQYGLQLVMYEGGTHVVGIGQWQEDEELTAFFLWLNASDGMAGLYDELLQGWKDAGGTLFNAFTDIGRHDRFGSWGARQHIDDDSARWQSLSRFNRNNPAWWDERAPDSFIGTRETGNEPSR